MRSLQLTLEPGDRDIHPLFAVLADSSFVAVARMLDWNVIRTETSTVLFHVVGDPDPFEPAVTARDVVLDVELTRVDDRSFYAYIHSETTDTERAIYLAFTQERSLLVPPLVYRDGAVTCNVLGTAKELRAALADVPDGIEATVERVGRFQDAPGPARVGLTDRQREALRAARAVGYYQVPREATAADVAERLDCSPSTASEHLRKAEARLVEAFLPG